MSNQKKLAVTALLTTLFAIGVGCSKHHSSSNPQQSTTFTDMQQKQSACPTSQDDSIAPESKVQKQTASVVRQLQVVKTVDCNGKTISQKEQVVSEDEGNVTLTPVGHLNSSTSSVRGWIRNRTTCRRYGKVLSSSANDVKSEFALTTSADVRGSLYVVGDQTNYIDYRFYNCTDAKDTRCVSQKVLEEGTLILKVKSSDEHVSGVKKVEFCPRDASGKPVSIL
jgi:hypothetical protein